MLTLLGDKLLPSGIQDGLIALCPTMDLLAVASKDNQVQVFRVNGEVVFAIPKNRTEAEVTQLRWKPNGRLLAIGYKDGTLLLINTHTGSIVQKVQATGPEASPIRYLGWSLNLTDSTSIEHLVSSRNSKVTLEGLIDRGFQGSTVELPSNLPMELAALEVEALLPKLSPLPALSRDEDLFSSRASLDALFHGENKENQESIDALLVGLDRGQMQLKIYDTFSLGQFATSNTNTTISNHASHPYASTHALIWQTGRDQGHKLYFQPLDIRPITDTGRYLSLIASKTTQLQNLLRYLNLASQQISNEFKSSQDLPKRFIRNVEESLQEHEHCSFIEAAYRLAVTGHCDRTTKEWLVDELGERGQKRWEKAAIAGYENVRQYVHENLLPGLQRFSILLSRLRGFSKFQDSSVALGIETQDLDQIFDTLNCVQLLGHCILVHANRELKEAVAFAAWLKREIELQGIDPTSASAEEHLESNIIPDYSTILQYIEGAMLHSRLYDLLDIDIDSLRPSWNLAQEGSALYENYKIYIKRIANDELPEKKLPGLENMLLHLSEQCAEVFTKISAAQGRKVRLGDAFSLGDGLEHIDMVMVPEADSSTGQQMNVYIAKVHGSKARFATITKVVLNIINGLSSIVGLSAASVELAKGLKIKDITFADSQDMVIMVSGNTQSKLLYIRFREASVGSEGLQYGPISTADEMGVKNDFSDPDSMEVHTKHILPTSEHPWQAGHIEINGRQGRRILCVVSEDNVRYALFDLDSWQHEEEENGQELEDDEIAR